jgi:hypothetical protein
VPRRAVPHEAGDADQQGAAKVKKPKRCGCACVVHGVALLMH